jgi:hypothetical protein
MMVALLALAFGNTSPSIAARIVDQPEGAYELRLGAVVLPGNTAGHVVFKPCTDCASISMSVTAATIYTVDRSVVPFADFLTAAQSFRSRQGGDKNTAVYVFYDVESRRVTRLALDHFGT